jgi:hypothetical protein
VNERTQFERALPEVRTTQLVPKDISVDRDNERVLAGLAANRIVPATYRHRCNQDSGRRSFENRPQ